VHVLRLASLLAVLVFNALAQTNTPNAADQAAKSPDALFVEGQKLFSRQTPDSLQAALADFQKAAEAWQKSGDEAKQVDALLSIATTQFLLHGIAACGATLDLAQQLVNAARDQLGQARVASGYAFFYDAQQDEKQAIQFAAQSADLFHALNRPADESQVLLLLSTLYYKTHDDANLIASYERALPVATAANNAQMEAFFNLRLGQFSLLRQGDDAHKEALAHFQKALGYYQNSTDQFDLAMTWWGLGDAYDYLHNYANARDAYQHAADLSSAIKNDSARGRIYRELGHEELKFKMWPQAAQHLEQAIALMKDDSPRTRALAEVELGMARQEMNDKAGALKAYDTAAVECHQAGIRDMEATSWLKIASLHAADYQWEQSIAASQNAVAASKSATKSEGGDDMLPAALISLGDGYLNRGNHQKSLEVDLEVLPMLHGNDRINVMISIGINYSWLAQYANALKYLNQGLSESTPGSAERAGVLVVRAEVHTSLNQLTTAMKQAQESREIYHKLQVANGEAKALNQLGIIYQWMGDRRNSEAVLNQALKLEQASNNIFAQCSTLNNLGELQRYFGDYRKAEPLYRQGLELATQIGDLYRQADILTNLGAVQRALGQETGALASLHRALEARRQLGDPNNEAKVLSDIGLVLVDNGEPQKGLEALTQAQALMQHTEDLPSKVGALDNLGSAYYSLGVYEDAETYFQQAQELAKSMSLDSSLAIVLNNLATLQLAQALRPGASEDYKAMRLQRAADLFQQALPLAQKIGDKPGQTHILNSQAVIESEQGHQQQALQTLRECLALTSQTGDIDSQALAEHTLGTFYSRLNDTDAAMRHYQAALALWPKIDSLDGEAQTYFVMAKTERKAGHLDKALTDVRKAIALSGQLNSRVATDENRTSLFATTSSYYEFEIDLLMELAKLHPGQGYEVQAFEASENGRARSLLDLLAEAHTDIRRGGDPALLAEEKTIVNSLAAKEALRRKLAQSPNGPGQKELEKDIATLKSRYDVVEAEIRERSPAYAALTQPKALTTGVIQHELLDDDTVLLEYSLGSERSYLWVLTSDSIAAHGLPSRAKLVEAANKLSARIRDKESIEDPAVLLSEALLKPAAGKLKKRVLIVADGELQALVPFSVLPAPEVTPAEPLLAQHEILIEPSASAVVILRRNEAAQNKAQKLLAVIADPVFSPNDKRLQASATQNPDPNSTPVTSDSLMRAADARDLDQSGYLPRLKGSGLEAETILQMSKPEQQLALLGFDANKPAVLDASLADYQIVHFATHGLANSDRPALSGLVLSLYDKQAQAIDGFLTLNDIYNLHLPVKLVVLSACESGQGEVVRGEGIVGLTRGFLYAGAQTLVVSLWNVDDQSTAELMHRFYQALLSQEKLRPTAALRNAQLSLMRDTQWRQPYYWAAFTVQGDWR
jgi:CHAT domain-containing protein/tetratricopeptide (TPR) repeat protein